MFFAMVRTGINHALMDSLLCAIDRNRVMNYRNEAMHNILRYKMMAAQMNAGQPVSDMPTYQQSVKDIQDAEFSPINDMDAWRDRVAPKL
jgi:hypothetical protein